MLGLGAVLVYHQPKNPSKAWRLLLQLSGHSRREKQISQSQEFPKKRQRRFHWVLPLPAWLRCVRPSARVIVVQESHLRSVKPTLYLILHDEFIQLWTLIFWYYTYLEMAQCMSLMERGCFLRKSFHLMLNTAIYK